MNIINRNNYEEYFILHLDNELNAEQQQALQHFLQQNPDLKAELDLLSGTKLSVDETVVFPDKNLLFAGNLIQEETPVSAQDSEIIMYLDAELTENDKKAFEQKLALSPVLQQELALFAKTKLNKTAAVVFPDKALLYKEEETKRRIVPMYWLRMGVAAAVLLTLGVGGFKWLNNPVKDTENGGLATVPVMEHKETTTVAPATETTAQVNHEGDQPVQTVIAPETGNQQVANTVAYNTNRNTGNTPVTNTALKNPVQTTGMANNSSGTNNLPSAGYKNPNVTGTNNTATANIGIPDIKPVDIAIPNNGIVIPSSVKNNTQPAFASNNQYALDEVVDVEEPENKKNKLRGFLRKVTRNFQKQTSIDMTNGDDQLLVAGFALKM
jgi:anti-sigma factor RsiW